ncbi:T9SS type A sorting domain-containing protein, partial [Candidatus Nomurabacteria bacterium]|nr:T9SS type A sorting domain-containing protein [Candidatus Nomurabacteria bacterium]
SAGQSYGQAGKKDYSFVYPYKECGKLYFRLAFEGKYSEVKVVTIPCDISIVAYDKTLRIQNKASGTLTIINSSGQTLARTVLANGQSEISVDLVSGVYIANFVDKNGMVFNQKFLIK